jgi:phage tail-like protein
VRNHVDGLTSPHPLGPTLPALFAEDDFAQRFVGGIDDVLSPLLSTLDNLPAYLDPWLAPPDFLDWLSHWVGAATESNEPVERRRAVIARAAGLYAWRGTARGLTDAIEAATGYTAEIRDSGGVAWSQRAGATRSSSTRSGVAVVLRVPDPGAVDRAHLDALVRAAVPAHLPVHLEVEQS